MKVLQITNDDIFAYNYLLPIVAEIKKLGFEVSFLCPDGDFSKKMRRQGERMIPYTLPRTYHPLHHLKAIWDLMAIVRGYDIVHCHTYSASIAGRIAAYLAGVPHRFYTSHGFFAVNQKFRRANPYFLFEGLLSRITTRYWSVNEYDAAMFRNDFYKACTFTKGVGYDSRIFRPFYPSENIRRQLGFSKKDLILTFSGRMIREKGIMELFEAFDSLKKKYPDLKLIYLGKAFESDRDQSAFVELKNKIRERKMDSEVRFEGFVKNLEDYFAITDIFCLPTYREGWPTCIIQAMAMKIPVVVSNVRGPNEQVIHGETGFLTPVREVSPLVDYLDRLCANKALRLQLGENGRKRVLENFPPEESVRRHLDYYQTLKKPAASTLEIEEMEEKVFS